MQLLGAPRLVALSSGPVWFDSFYVRVSTMTDIWTVGHRLRFTPMN